jgi:hypothetical protein
MEVTLATETLMILHLKWCRSKLGLVRMPVDTGIFDRLYDNGGGVKFTPQGLTFLCPWLRPRVL